MVAKFKAVLLLSALSAVAASHAQQPAVTEESHSTITRHDAPDTSQAKSVTAESFASQAASISAAEIELSTLALDRTQNQAVREYAKKIMSDHSAQKADLQKIAQQERFALTQDLSREQQAVKQKLTGLRGSQFDAEYAKAMSEGHEAAIALFESASQAPQLPTELKEFAASNLTKLKSHRELAHTL